MYAGSSNYSHSEKPCIDWRQTDYSAFCVYCRNPGGERERPWCFTTPKVWEYCDVPVCGKALSLPLRTPILYKAPFSYESYDNLTIDFALKLDSTVGNMSLISVPFEDKRGFIRIHSVLTHNSSRMLLLWVELGGNAYMVTSPPRPYTHFRIFAFFSTVKLEITVNDVPTTLHLYNKTYEMGIRLANLWEIGSRSLQKSVIGGCISDLTVVGIRPLDYHDRLVNEDADRPITWATDCLYVKSSDWKPSPTNDAIAQALFPAGLCLYLRVFML